MRDYKKEYEEYQGTPEQIHKRALRNAARRQMVDAGRAHKGDGNDVDHIHMLKEDGTHPTAAVNAPSDLRVVTAHANRSWRKGKRGY